MILTAMNIKTIKANKATKGYWSNGRFVKPEEIAAEEVGPPSKTQLKAEADEKQALGEALLSLRADLMARLDLPAKLLDAIAEAKRITHFEGRRRQLQFIGKLMRPLDAAPIREAIAEQQGGSAQLTLTLHLAEQWRDQLIGSDEALGRWLTEHPDTDSQQLRALIRQARKDAKADKPESAGEAPRHGKPYREIFQMVKQALGQQNEEPQEPDA
ncbi:MAG: ribosome-associated protein [Burkholderiales bacterium RIFCSPHIGHO2_12_FULL_61_11]|nr:MAG: ribosome-associated protein [Burkholderiales bacterium RIFCSPHIGHO2_12_FULL_61_11]